MLGQELDSLADLVRISSRDVIFHPLIRLLDIIWRRTLCVGLRDWAADVVGHRSFDRLRLLWSRTTREVQRHRRPHPKKCLGKVKLFRGTPYPILSHPR